MRPLPGYALGEEVPTGSGLVSYRARRVRDGRAVRVSLPSGHGRDLAERLVYGAGLACELDENVLEVDVLIEVEAARGPAETQRSVNMSTMFSSDFQIIF